MFSGIPFNICGLADFEINHQDYEQNEYKFKWPTKENKLIVFIFNIKYEMFCFLVSFEFIYSDK